MTDQQELEILKQQQPDLVAAMRALIDERLHALFKVQRESFIRIVRTLEHEYAQGKPTVANGRNSASLT